MKNFPLKAVMALLLTAVMFLSCTDFDPFAPPFNKKLWSERVAPIVEGCETDYEKAKAIYDWMSENIVYDNTYSIYNAYDCWEKRTGVCQAFSELYANLAKGCDLSVGVVHGVCRNSDVSDGKAGHAWNKVKTEKGWILLDVTWGSCYGHHNDDWETWSEGSRVWFDVHPDIMVFTHFPNNSKAQLKSTPVSREKYLILPNLTPNVCFWGWNASSALEFFLQHPQAKAPEIYVVPNGCWGSNEFLEYPFSMEEGKEYTIRILNMNPEYPPTHEDWNVEGDVYSCTASAGFTLYVGGCGILHYPSVAKSDPEEDLYTFCYPSE